jgi:hypothetical protein
MDNRTWSYFRGWTDAHNAVPPRPEDYPEPDAYAEGYRAASERRAREEDAAD